MINKSRGGSYKFLVLLNLEADRTILHSLLEILCKKYT